MKTLLLSLASLAVLSGCVVTGGAEYTDPKTGATAHIGISKEFKPKADGKAAKPLAK